MPTSTSNALGYTVQIPRARFTAFLVLVVLVLLINHLMLQFFYHQWDAGHWVLRDMFDVDEEENFPTCYSSFALLFSAGLLYAIASQKRREHDRFAPHWLGLSIIFLAMSIDEIAGMHEALNTVTEFPWTIPAAVVAAVVALIYLPFLIHLPKPTRIGFLLAGVLFAGGAIGVEHASDWYLEEQSMDSFGYSLLTLLEEGMEMFGVVLFINALLGYMQTGKAAEITLAVEETEFSPP